MAQLLLVFYWKKIQFHPVHDFWQSIYCLPMKKRRERWKYFISTACYEVINKLRTAGWADKFFNFFLVTKEQSTHSRPLLHVGAFYFWGSPKRCFSSLNLNFIIFVYNDFLSNTNYVGSSPLKVSALTPSLTGSSKLLALILSGDVNRIWK